MVIDVVLILIVSLGAYLGYKKGLISVLVGFVAIIIAIILSLILQNPIANLLKSGNIGKNIYDNVYQCINDTVENRKNGTEDNTMYIKIINGIISDEQKEYQANNITMFILRGISFIITFIISFVIIFILKSVLNLVFDLPILKSINKIGGLALGTLKTIVIIYIILAAVALLSELPSSKMQIKNKIEQTNITKMMYNNNVLLKIINRNIKV